MKIPTMANDEDIDINMDSKIRNTYYNVEYLSTRQAVDLINWLSSGLLVEMVDVEKDEC